MRTDVPRWASLKTIMAVLAVFSGHEACNWTVVQFNIVTAPLFLARGRSVSRIGRSARIGVEYAGAWARRQLRFFDAKSAHVSQR